ncbi:MAG TPA: DUF3501 family protein [Acidimicrobiales bacterium]|nr:DUF3501 family protein [Acidimicrobiales bacterium]
MTQPSQRALRLEDIEDIRQYERSRDEFRRRIIELKARRRVAVGPFVTLLFENRDTIRFQVQEMARVERMVSDEQIQGELDVYNPLIPGPGELSATLFVELTDEPSLRQWLPKLVGIERAVELHLGDGEERSNSATDVVSCIPEQAHEEQLTRADVTSSVHYIRFVLTPAQVQRFADERVTLAVAHPSYRETTVLTSPTRAELLGDLRP